MDLAAVISTVRHGHKDEVGNLTSTGVDQAKIRGITLKHLKGDIILFHSGVGRVKDTIRAVASHLHLNNESELNQELLDKFNLQDYIAPNLHYLLDPQNKGELFSQWDNMVHTQEESTSRMQRFLNQNDFSAEPDVYPSPKQMAKRMARVIFSQILFASITDSSFRTNFINGTHEPVIMSFLYYYLNDYKDNSEHFVIDVGGSVDFAEGFDILVYQNLNVISKIEFIFRNIKKELDLNLLKEFSFDD